MKSLKKNRVKYYFKLLNDKKNKNGEYPIYLYITYNQVRKKIATGHHILKECWIDKTRRLIPKDSDCVSINDSLDMLEKHLDIIIKYFHESKTKISLDLIKDSLHSFDRFYEGTVKSTNDSDETVGKLTLKTLQILFDNAGITQKNFYRYKRDREQFMEFISIKFNVDDVKIGYLNDELLMEYEEYLLKVKNYTPMSTYKNYQRLARLIKIGVDKKLIKSMPFNYKSNEYRFYSPDKDETENKFCEEIPFDLSHIPLVNNYSYIITEVKDFNYHKENGNVLYKFGFSTNPYVRLKDLQTGSPHTYGVVKYYKNAVGTTFERFIHQKYKNNKYRSEWFSFSPEINISQTLFDDYKTYLLQSLVQPNNEEKNQKIKEETKIKEEKTLNVVKPVVEITDKLILETFEACVNSFGKGSNYLIAYRIGVPITKLYKYIGEHPELKEKMKQLKCATLAH